MWSVLHLDYVSYCNLASKKAIKGHAMIIEFIFQPISRFDEVHFGRFTNYILNGTFFFDVHPPFAKLVFAYTGIYIFVGTHHIEPFAIQPDTAKS